VSHNPGALKTDRADYPSGIEVKDIEHIPEVQAGGLHRNLGIAHLTRVDKRRLWKKRNIHNGPWLPQNYSEGKESG
jgi:hypothetical protein